MRTVFTGKFALLAVILVLAAASLACSLGGASPTATSTPVATSAPAPTSAQAPTAAPAAATEPPAAAETATTEPKPTEAGGSPNAIPTVVGLNKLDSYHMEIVFRVENKDGTVSGEGSMKEDWVREPPAKHSVINFAGFEVETIQIGDKAWTKFGNQWTESQPSSDDLGSSMSEFTSDNAKMTFVGEETINGVNCKHYKFDEDVPGSGGTGTSHGTGDIWVASQSDVPAILVRMRASIQGSFIPMPGEATPVSPEDQQTIIEYDVTNINQPIDIQPPATPAP